MTRTDFKTYFICHTKGAEIDHEKFQLLWEKGTVAIHYPSVTINTQSGKMECSSDFDNTEFEKEKKHVERMLQLAKNGGLVCSTNSFYKGNDYVLIGQVSKGSKIEINEEICWKTTSDRYGEFNGEPARLKTLKLQSASIVRRSMHGSFMAGLPIHQTICTIQREEIKKIIHAIVKGKQVEPSPELLSTEQMETACAEFLRFPNQLYDTLDYLVMPVGRTMKDVDILGKTKSGKTIYAQVTYADTKEKTQNKLNALIKFSGEYESIKIMFVKQGVVPDLNQDKVIIIPISEQLCTVHRIMCEVHEQVNKAITERKLLQI